MFNLNTAALTIWAAARRMGLTDVIFFMFIQVQEVVLKSASFFLDK